MMSRDGSRDFDWEIGTWTTHVRVLRGAFTPEASWLEFEGTSVVHPFCDGAANLVELDVANASGRIRGVSLRLYNPEAGQWSLNFANLGDGVLTSPTFGEFTDDRGEFFGVDTLRGRAILVRFVILKIDDDSARFEQSFSADSGATWELTWVATDTRTIG
ncbi:hypothetical protein [Hamadaea tsunoensis]|uniref:hypothetical protein n=1 Tax=Hamadaea tsunoensis TaxID=53368 RepID=UPI00042103D5|nr:hypothetical protein [Hamadaea tsunoensis]